MAGERISGSAGRRGIEVNFGDLGVNGTLEIYCSNVASVTRNGETLRAGSGYTYDGSAKKLIVPFSGPTSLRVPGAIGPFGR